MDQEHVNVESEGGDPEFEENQVREHMIEIAKPVPTKESHRADEASRLNSGKELRELIENDGEFRLTRVA